MEARAQFRQPGISKGLIAMVVVSVTLGLGVMAGTLAKPSTGTSTIANHAVLQGKGGLAVQSVRHGGVQTVEENAPTSTAVGPDDRAGSPALAPTSVNVPFPLLRYSESGRPSNRFGAQTSGTVWSR